MDYMDVCKDPKLKKYKGSNKKVSLGLYKEIESKCGGVNEELWSYFRGWIESNLRTISEKIGNKKLNYVKIFLDCPIAEYKKEYKKYLVPNVLTEPEKNDSGVVGVHSFNMNLNNKKTFLLNYTKKCKYPSVVSVDEAIGYSELGILLNSYANSGIKLVYIGDGVRGYKEREVDFAELKLIEPKYLVKIEPKNGIAIVTDFEVIVSDLGAAKVEIDFATELGSIQSIVSEYSVFNKLPNKGVGVEKLERWELIGLIDSAFFCGGLRNNLFSAKVDIGKSALNSNDKVKIHDLILKYRSSIVDYLYKGRENYIVDRIDTITMDALKVLVSIYGNHPKVVDALILRDILINYYKGDRGMSNKLKVVDSELEALMLKKDVGVADLLTDKDMYSYLLGSVYNYLLSLSKTSSKSMDTLNVLLCKTKGVALKCLNSAFKRYGYAIDDRNSRFKNLYYLLQASSIEGLLNEELVIAGYLGKSLIYRKIDKPIDVETDKI